VAKRKLPASFKANMEKMKAGKLGGRRKKSAAKKSTRRTSRKK
jgi:hypothetical protein